MTRVIPFPTPPISKHDRDRLIVEHLPLVRIAARSIKRRLPPSFELDDLVGEGTLGLISAANTYDPAKGPFKVRAQFLINAAILESVRRRNWTANTMVGIEGVNRVSQFGSDTTISITKPEEMYEHRRIADPLGQDPRLSENTLNATLDETRKRKVLDFAIAGLRPRHRSIVNSYYREGRPITVVARKLGIEASRASQLHHEALRALAVALRQQGVRIEYADLRTSLIARSARAAQSLKIAA